MIKEDKLNELMLRSSTPIEDVIDATYISDEHKSLIEALYDENKERESFKLFDSGSGSSEEDYYYYSQAELKLLRVVSLENKILINGGVDKLLDTYKEQVVQLTNTVKGLIELVKERT